MTGATLTDAFLDGATLADADLRRVRSGGIAGTPASLPDGWQLTSGFLVGPAADLSGANLKAAGLTGATLTDAFLDGATLADADLRRVRSGGIAGTPASLPDGWQLTSGFLVGPGADLSGADLSKASLRGATLTEAAMHDAILPGSSFELFRVRSGGIEGTPTLPPDWMLVRGYLVGPGADLSNADLANSDLSDARLDGARLLGASLNDTNLSYATLASVSSGGVTGTPSSLPQPWKLVNGYLVGPSADLRGAELANADLTNAGLASADLSDADLDGARLSGADLTLVTSVRIRGKPRDLPENWQLVKTCLLGPTADLRGVDLSLADLSELDLSSSKLAGADLYRCSLRGAKLVDVTLEDAQLFRANIAGADLSRARIAGADLRGARCDSQTVFDEALLVTRAPTAGGPISDPLRGSMWGGSLDRSICLSGIHWNGASIREAKDVSELRRLGDDVAPGMRRNRKRYFQRKHTASDEAANIFAGSDPTSWVGSRLSARQKRNSKLSYAQREFVDPSSTEDRQGDPWHHHPDTYFVYQHYLSEALAAYRSVAVAVREAGHTHLARRLEYRARQLDTRVHGPIGRELGRLTRHPLGRLWRYARQTALSSIDLVCGYGYKPLRILCTYAVVVLSFAGIYSVAPATSYVIADGAGPPPHGWNTIAYSLIAFHGRGVLYGDIAASSGFVWVPAVEAVIGLFVEAVFVAVLVRSLFRD